MLSIVKETYWNIPGYIIFWGLFIIAFVLFAKRIALYIRLLCLGQKENRFDRIGLRMKSVLVELFLGRGTLKYVTPKDVGGLGHAFLVWGFGLFVMGYVLFIGLAEGFGLYKVIMGGRFERFCLSVLDITGLFLFIGISCAAIKRYIVRPERLDESTKSVGVLLPLLFIFMFALVLFHYCIAGLRYAITEIPVSCPSISVALAGCFKHNLSEADLLITYQAIWWLNYIIILGFLVYSSRSDHRHPMAAPVNIFFRCLDGRGVLKLHELEKAETFGVSKISDFSWKQLLDLYACTECGRCNEVCPAALSGKNLKPRNVILNLLEHLLDNGKNLLSGGDGERQVSDTKQRLRLVGDIVTQDELWQCTNCLACVEVCPVMIEHLDKIEDMRQYSVLMESEFPPEYKKVFNNLEIFGDNLGKGPLMREEWTSRLSIKKLYQGSDDVDCLFWVGCQGSVDDRNTDSTIAAARILEKAGVRFRILGKEEVCCGDPALRMGNEYLFQKLARQNIELFQKYGINKIVTSCPHCYSTLKNEYSDFGDDFEVQSLIELIPELIADRRLTIKSKINGSFTYHDPCFLGRYNSIYEEPRKVLGYILDSGIKEMTKSRNDSFCCGAGGGNFWKGRSVGKRIEEIRTEEGIETGADGVITACPFCNIMFNSAIRQKGVEHSFKLIDIVQLVNQAT